MGGCFWHTISQYELLSFIVSDCKNNKIKNSPSFFSSMSVVRYFNGLLILVSERCEYWSIMPFRLFIFESWVDKILTEAPNCMTLEIRCGSTILRVQVAVNTLVTLSLAILRSTPKKMELSALVISNRDLCLKKFIDRRTPTVLEPFYNYKVWWEIKNE